LDAGYTGNDQSELQAARDLEEFTARILGEDPITYLSRTWREYVKEHRRQPNFGDVGRTLYEGYESSLIATQRFTASGVGGWGQIVFKSASLRPVGPGWFVRWRNL